MVELTTAQRDRALGSVLGMAAGDALGAGYEFGPPLPGDAEVAMTGGGSFGWAPGEWTDDTSMAVPILRAAAAGEDLAAESAWDRIGREWADWAREAKDVGVQTSAVLSAARRAGVSAATLREASREHHERNGRSAGNGSLMRTAPVALAYLDDPDGLTDAATAISQLTHWEDDAAQACVLWCHLIRHAILTGELDREVGLAALPTDARAVWAQRLDEAEQRQPRDFDKNGWVVHALQAAWCAITTTPVPEEDAAARVFPADHLRLVLEAAVRGGRDTDTVAAIAGGLVGALWGASALPFAWRRILHGWPGLDAVGLAQLVNAATGGAVADHQPDYVGFATTPTVVVHPADDGVLLGNIAGLRTHPEVDAVVSLCRVSRKDAPQVSAGDWDQVWLIDKSAPGENPNLAFVLSDAADAVHTLRQEGKRVFLHCVEAISRTPSVAALYAARHRGVPVEQAIADVAGALPSAYPKPFLTDAVRRLAR